ncbi:MAG: TadE/TadG family type IV pilus assembly protein [Ilumatobacteraceae bacterium]
MTRRDRDRDRDRGEAAAQLVIITPILVLLIFLAVQAAIYFHAANVAAAAASQGAAAASPRTAGAGDGVSAAQQLMADLGADSTGAPVVVIGGGFVTVTVTVDVPRIVPFFPDSVSRTALEPQERFVPETDR